MQVIITKYIPATSRRPSRIKATCDRGSVTIPYPYEGTDSHLPAVLALIAKFVLEDLNERREPVESNPWNRPFISGGLPNQASMAHVFLPYVS